MAKHAQSVHQAQAHWEGGLTDGKGRITGSSSGQLAEVPMTWNARTGGDNTLTSPEELLAAAHAACFSMALAHELQGRKAEPRSLDVSAAVGFDPKVGGGFAVSFSELTVKADVPGISDADFQEAVQQAAEGCPVSQALKGNVEITAEAELV
ncbi:MAG: putative ATP/GTP-binding protein [Thermomicrobiales bacterium]|jgi:osmotically inducible protein OsmC|nr:putative ATP/GTP-binding protein [Thermomicrobiales bacterium]